MKSENGEVEGERAMIRLLTLQKGRIFKR